MNVSPARRGSLTQPRPPAVFNHRSAAGFSGPTEDRDAEIDRETGRRGGGLVLPGYRPERGRDVDQRTAGALTVIKKEDVKIGTTYSAVIGGLPADLKITGPAKTGG